MSTPRNGRMSLTFGAVCAMTLGLAGAACAGEEMEAANDRDREDVQQDVAESLEDVLDDEMTVAALDDTVDGKVEAPQVQAESDEMAEDAMDKIEEAEAEAEAADPEDE